MSQMHKETLQAELKMVREDIHRVTLELTERQQRVDKLHAKHDVLVSRNATPDGEVHSQVSARPGLAQARSTWYPAWCVCLVASTDNRLHSYIHVKDVIVKPMTLVSFCASTSVWHVLASWHALLTAREMT